MGATVNMAVPHLSHHHAHHTRPVPVRQPRPESLLWGAYVLVPVEGMILVNDHSFPFIFIFLRRNMGL